MYDLKFLDSYTGQSTEELIALEGTYRTDSLASAFEEAIDLKSSHIGYDYLTDEERVILAIEALQREVNNGGYHQFFLNSSGLFAPIVVDALKRIGCADTAALTQEAIDALGIRDPLTKEAIDAVIYGENSERDKKLHECDTRYYENAGDLAIPLFEYIKSNRDKIDLGLVQGANRIPSLPPTPIIDQKTADAPKNIPTIAHVVCGWPLLLVLIGGAIGGGLGGLAYGINVAIYKSRLPVVAKVLLNIIVGLSAIGIWFVIVMVIRSMKK